VLIGCAGVPGMVSGCAKGDQGITDPTGDSKEPPPGGSARHASVEAHAAALRAQDDWMERNGHPFADARESPFRAETGG
jgi:hypothetical protein